MELIFIFSVLVIFWIGGIAFSTNSKIYDGMFLIILMVLLTAGAMMFAASQFWPAILILKGN